MLTNLEAWIRRRLRSYLWRQWHKIWVKGVYMGQECLCEGRQSQTPASGPAAAGKPLSISVNWLASLCRFGRRRRGPVLGTAAAPASPAGLALHANCSTRRTFATGGLNIPAMGGGVWPPSKMSGSCQPSRGCFHHPWCATSSRGGLGRASNGRSRSLGRFLPGTFRRMLGSTILQPNRLSSPPGGTSPRHALFDGWHS